MQCGIPNISCHGHWAQLWAMPLTQSSLMPSWSTYVHVSKVMNWPIAAIAMFTTILLTSSGVASSIIQPSTGIASFPISPHEIRSNMVVIVPHHTPIPAYTCNPLYMSTLWHINTYYDYIDTHYDYTHTVRPAAWFVFSAPLLESSSAFARRPPGVTGNEQAITSFITSFSGSPITMRTNKQLQDSISILHCIHNIHMIQFLKAYIFKTFQDIPRYDPQTHRFLKCSDFGWFWG